MDTNYENAIQLLLKDLVEAEKELEKAISQSMSTYKRKLKRAKELYWAIERLNFKKENNL